MYKIWFRMSYDPIGFERVVTAEDQQTARITWSAIKMIAAIMLSERP